MIAIIDYGAGNLFSVANALAFLGAEYEITDDKDKIARADGLILPGVGAFPDAMEKLRQKDLVTVIKETAGEKPFLGICLGMQVMFETGSEFTNTEGLGLIKGTVDKMTAPRLKYPHMGWNQLNLKKPCPLTAGLPADAYVYFVHSYAATAQTENIAATTDYGEEIPALVFKGNIYGAQFHPEKSGKTGLGILQNFVNLCGK